MWRKCPSRPMTLAFLPGELGRGQLIQCYVLLLYYKNEYCWGLNVSPKFHIEPEPPEGPYLETYEGERGHQAGALTGGTGVPTRRGWRPQSCVHTDTLRKSPVRAQREAGRREAGRKSSPETAAGRRPSSCTSGLRGSGSASRCVSRPVCSVSRGTAVNRGAEGEGRGAREVTLEMSPRLDAAETTMEISRKASSWIP